MAEPDAATAPETAVTGPGFRPGWIAAGIVTALAIQLIEPPGELSGEAWAVVSLTVLMVMWWVSEAVPIPVTSLLPLVVLPLSGVMTIGEASAGYSNPTVILLLGGFIIAKSIERWRLHERLALNVVARSGDRPEGLLAGFMIASALLSMWISNTATAIMLAPIALSVAATQASNGHSDGQAPPGLALALLLGVAYGCSIGGLGTPVGTPTNLIVLGYLQSNLGVTISFAQWMVFGVLAIAVLLPAAWLVLRLWALPVLPSRVPLAQAEAEAAPYEPDWPESTPVGPTVQERLARLGPMSVPERRIAWVFALVALLWVFSRPLSQLSLGGLVPFGGLTDHVIAILGAILLFVIPSGSAGQKRTALLDWATASRIPWGVILLFGGGLSLAAAISGSGLSTYLGDQMTALTTLPVLVLVACLVTFVLFATEVTSNVATASALMPVVGAVALGGNVDPVLLAVPVALAASCAFMLPMATGPNAIVFATGKVSMGQMAGIGLRLNLIAIVLLSGLGAYVAPLFFL